MIEKSERLEILEMIQNGVISASQGADLLKALENAYEDGVAYDQDEEEIADQTAHETDQSPTQQDEEGFTGKRSPEEESLMSAQTSRRRGWWLVPLWAGTAITILSGALMYWAFQSTGFSFWFACAWLPFLFGLALMALGGSSRNVRWLHLRVQQKHGEWPERIAFSFPLPLRLAAWFLRTFGRFIPKFEGTGIDEIILALEQNTNAENPFYVEVDEGEDGERVQIYIG